MLRLLNLPGLVMLILIRNGNFLHDELFSPHAENQPAEQRWSDVVWMAFEGDGQFQDLVPLQWTAEYGVGAKEAGEDGR